MRNEAGLQVTLDGGSSWNQIKSPLDFETLDFVDAEIGWATAIRDGCNGATTTCAEVSRTTDGGLTWTPILTTSGTAGSGK